MSRRLAVRSGSGGDVMTREACDPYTATASVSLADMLTRLTRCELESLAVRFYGRCPERFEELVLQFWAERAAEETS